MRYEEELRKPAEYFDKIKKVAIDDDQLSLAKELIKRKAAKFAPEKFKDEYETALRAMVEAKVNNAPVPKEEPAPTSGKVINLMEALRKSVEKDSGAEKKPAASVAKKGISLVKPKAQKRKSA
jgi:DNA end-binding protein Ku